MFTLVDQTLVFESATQTVRMENGRILSLVSKVSGREYISCPGSSPALFACWRGNIADAWPDSERKVLDTGKIETRLLSPNVAQVLFHSWYGDGILLLQEDEENGDLLVRPSVSSGRPGVKAAGWEIPGIAKDLYAVLPANQGIRLKLDDPLLAGHKFGWPSSWEIGLCMFETDRGDGFWVYCQDNRYQFKDIFFGEAAETGKISLLSEAYGPLDDCVSAGNVTWRINVFEGGWRVPAAAYRDWYYGAYGLAKEKRLPWLKDVKMAISWADSNVEFLEALATKVDPSKVLIHMATWRDAKYDQEYPDYWPSAKAAEYINRGAELGFKICPHMNSMEIDPSHEVYPLLSLFQSQNLDTRTVYGWGFDGPTWKYLGVPWTEFAKTDPRNREYNIMAKIHPGSSLWHAELYERMRKVAEAFPVAGCFIDVSLCLYNLHNCLVEGRTMCEGINDMIRLLSQIRGGLPIGGEGLNEITAQHQSFAQMHLYGSTHFSCEGLERCGGDCAVNDFILGDLCKVIGYHALAGRNEDELTRARVYADHNAVPTIITNNPKEVLEPNAYVASVMAQAQ